MKRNTEMEAMYRNVKDFSDAMYPVLLEDTVDLRKYNKIPIGKIASLGVGFNSISTAVQNYTTLAANPTTGAVSGIYKVTVDPGQHLTYSAAKEGYIGMARNADNVVKSQATMTPIHFDPTMVFMAATMYCVHMKLDAIQETQEDIMKFLEQKEKAELRGNVIVLGDIIENYKYNWNNDQYLRNNHMKVLDIRQKAEQSILFAQARIKDITEKKKIIPISTDVNAKVRKLNKVFEDYQLAMYTFAMSSYVEAMLLKNFEKGYMYNIADKIEEYSIKYRELYTDCYNALEKLSDKSVDNLVIGGLGKISKVAGEAVASIPVISKTEIDENLIAVSEIISDSDEVIRDNRLLKLVSKQSSYVGPYVDSIKMLGELHDKPLNILFDEDNIYLEKVAV